MMPVGHISTQYRATSDFSMCTITLISPSFFNERVSWSAQRGAWVRHSTSSVGRREGYLSLYWISLVRRLAPRKKVYNTLFLRALLYFSLPLVAWAASISGHSLYMILTSARDYRQLLSYAAHLYARQPTTAKITTRTIRRKES